MKKVTILGVDFEHITHQDMLNLLVNKIKKQKKTFVVTANPEIVMYANKDEEYLRILQSADHVVPDGSGIILASKLIQEPLPERVAGFDLTKDLLMIANDQQFKVYFLGAKEQTLKDMIYNVKKTYPQLSIAGYHHGYFQEGKDEHIIQAIKESKPDLVFVALGFPRQEQWIYSHFQKFEKGIFMGVGGSFDILAGHAKRAPKIWRKLNLEWLYRLIQQPSRWKRMLALPQFIIKVFQYKRTFKRIN